jgi:hypothetical protein
VDFEQAASSAIETANAMAMAARSNLRGNTFTGYLGGREDKEKRGKRRAKRKEAQRWRG